MYISYVIALFKKKNGILYGYKYQQSRAWLLTKIKKEFWYPWFFFEINRGQYIVFLSLDSLCLHI